MELTERQVHRQMLRIREGIFDNFETLDGNLDAYTGELKPDIKSILKESIITDKVLSEEDFMKLFHVMPDLDITDVNYTRPPHPPVNPSNQQF